MSETILDVKKNGPPVGYNPIAEIRGAMFHEICVPFNGVPVWCYVTCLNAVQKKSCGNLSCLYFDKNEDKINTIKLKIKCYEIEIDKLKLQSPKDNIEKLNIEKQIIQTQIQLSQETETLNQLTKENIIDLIERRNIQEALVKLTLVRPDFDEIAGMITETNFLISKNREELEKLNKIIKTMPPGKEKKELEKKAERIEFYLGFPLPDDTMGFLTTWALGIEITDIKKLSENLLLDAAIMAHRGGDNPSDHLSGIFTDFQKDDINKHAWILHNKFTDQKNREKEIYKNKGNWVKNA